MNEKLLTIVVPSYNVEKYLDECIPPYVTPTYDERLEVIIVNDGSTDSTRNIAEKYAKQYSKVIRVLNKENGGHGSTINAGLAEARGKYFKVIDGDDYTDNAELIRFLDILEKSDEDAVTNNRIVFYEGTDKKEKHYFNQSLEPDTIIPIQKINRMWNFEMHRITVKTALLKKHMPQIDEHCFYVDQEMNFYSLAVVNTLRITDAVIYYYRLGNVNQSVSRISMYKRRNDLLKVIDSLLEFYPTLINNITTENGRDYIDYNIGMQFTHYARAILLNGQANCDDACSVLDLFNRIKDNYKGIYKIIKNNKATMLLRCVGPKFYIRVLLPIISKRY